VTDLVEWPSVARAVRENAATLFTSADARRAERGWFEERGIAAALCAPMALDGEVVGTLFFDYRTAPDRHVDLMSAKRAADVCAALVRLAA
jgi:hypothetical protein